MRTVLCRLAYQPLLDKQVRLQAEHSKNLPDYLVVLVFQLPAWRVGGSCWRATVLSRSLSRPPSPSRELEAQGPKTGICLAPPLGAAPRLAPIWAIEEIRFP